MSYTLNDSLPYYIESISGDSVLVTQMGEEKTVGLGEFVGRVSLGDFVFVIDGVIISTIAEADAVELLEMVEKGPYV